MPQENNEEEDLQFHSDYALDNLIFERVEEEREVLVLDLPNQRFKIKGITPLHCSFYDADYRKDGIIYSSFAEEEEDDEI
jgi:hypothetical protein